ncbi:Uncharacterised protein [uncultured archaeon]|nr:Uncharacterised protein [uncultured archaeon]
MSRCKLISDKYGQTGETVAWIIATLIIVGILILSIVITVLMSKTKVISLEGVQTDLSQESKVLAEKTFLANELAGNSNDERVKINKIINENDAQNNK